MTRAYQNRIRHRPPTRSWPAKFSSRPLRPRLAVTLGSKDARRTGPTACVTCRLKYPEPRQALLMQARERRDSATSIHFNECQLTLRQPARHGQGRIHWHRKLGDRVIIQHQSQGGQQGPPEEPGRGRAEDEQLQTGSSKPALNTGQGTKLVRQVPAQSRRTDQHHSPLPTHKCGATPNRKRLSHRGVFHMVPEIVDGQQCNRQKTRAEPSPKLTAVNEPPAAKMVPETATGPNIKRTTASAVPQCHGIRTSRVRPRQHRRGPRAGRRSMRPNASQNPIPTPNPSIRPAALLGLREMRPLATRWGLSPSTRS